MPSVATTTAVTVVAVDQAPRITVVSVDQAPRITVVSVDQAPRITVVSAGQGLQGPPGAAGSGGSGNAYYVHTQSTPLSTWVINHNFGARPNISVTSMGGVEYLVEIIHPTANQAVVYFEAPAVGFATCS